MEGILLLHKPKGLTSHDCVFKLRKILKTKKVGHTGTLDPDVTGVLPICIGRATKIAEYMTGDSKTYVGEVTLGYSTTTEDASGETVKEVPVDRVITRDEILQVLHKLTGEIKQTPPMYSAVKVNGKKLYEYARKGQTIERPSRDITIYDLNLLDDRDSFEGNQISFSFKVTCSKGTYVRTLAVTIGEELGYPAHMSHLVRTASGPFQLDECSTFEEIEQAMETGAIDSILIPIERALKHLPNLEIDDKVAVKVRNGAVLETSPILEEHHQVLLLDQSGQALAIYEKHPTKPGLMKPTKVLYI
ncbi:tRNA pseudouridine55 synthase [Bacillus mesophilus]|uniref:tRNA pseudouridine synthase B n=1 Tax=Bacillus mesophilus TaxID=1808955 RepID=A0A6M0Q355_9BACI|nr:tRNA pseudouridine(55) synthase TruB [Bacillus mesophilus]MBM7659317.1 tRNA pseudouridine55 synthase [Bacillus mesophilus]NEY70189.1 tRNA pseudouridine(55) synthase TruB [Bacillus mesophilus]